MTRLEGLGGPPASRCERSGQPSLCVRDRVSHEEG
jgi:hypothetical protein